VKIFSAEQIKEWDKYTIEHEPISSIDLMERAAKACYNWLTGNYQAGTFKIICGKGNNGGDGLAIARMLLEKGYIVLVYILEADNDGSADFRSNYQRLKNYTSINYLRSISDLQPFAKEDIIIDSLFGTGLNKPLSGLAAEVVDKINNSGATIVSIDIPSGLFADNSSIEGPIVKADHTLTFQEYKLAFLISENEPYFGKVVVLDIGLHKKYYEQAKSKYEVVDASLIKNIYKPRKEFSHKGNYGHALLIAGSYGMMGAAVLAAKACLRSGVGKLSCLVPEAGYEIMQISVPEAMCVVSGKKHIKNIEDYSNYTTIGIGPGMGRHDSHTELLRCLYENFKKPLVIDADGLNTIAKHDKLLHFIPENSIVTPHPKEFDKLFGQSANDFERIEKAVQRAKDHNIYIILKGHRTLIAQPSGKAYFNSTGNAGMATGGSGDVLTGVLTGLLAQGYTPIETCLLGVYLHGLAGDSAARRYSTEGLIASDIINCLSGAFCTVNT
jgi:ADP-dependent NAD(P)H-hydrate dehydratase / NAD(P)H-hydrate epimerase